MVAVALGFVFLQLGVFGSGTPVLADRAAQDAGATQLASADTRSGEATASRGSGRTPDAAAATAEAARTPALVASADEPNPTTTSTTVVPATTTTAAPKPNPAPPAEMPKATAPVPKPAVSDAGPIGDDVWRKLANCEAGGRNDAGAPYYGYFLFSAQTWHAVGGSGLPSDNDYETQKSFAQKLQVHSGWGQWPVCSKKIGAA